MGLNPKRGLNLIETVPALLRQRPNQRLTARAITELIRETSPEAWSQKQERARHNDTQARNQVGAEIASHRHEMQRRNSEFTWFDADEPGKVRQ